LSTQTLAMIKPDAIASGLTGKIIELIELNGFSITNILKKTLSVIEVKEFYAIHSHRSWFNDYIKKLISGPVVLMVLEREDAVGSWRALMGATNPVNADIGTIRKMWGKSIDENVAHGSDSKENALKEIKFFF
jgi:nucleoside-diphosphate kinase